MSRGGESLAVRRTAGVTGGHADRVHALSGAASRGRAWRLSDWRTGRITVCSKKKPEQKMKRAVR